MSLIFLYFINDVVQDNSHAFFWDNYPFGTFDEDGTYRILSAEESWWGPLHGTSQEAPVIYANRPNFLYLTVIIPIQKMNTYSADPVSALENLESDIANHMNILVTFSFK